MDIIPNTLITLVLFFYACCICCGEHVLHTFRGKVGASNFTYYKVFAEGEIRLNLVSIVGDADMYVSGLTLKPDYENYEMCSATCGEDELLIPSTMSRPAAIGIFGHPMNDVSEYSFTATGDAASSRSAHTPYERSSKHAAGDDDFESFAMNVMGFFWKIILEILL